MTINSILEEIINLAKKYSATSNDINTIEKCCPGNAGKSSRWPHQKNSNPLATRIVFNPAKISSARI